MTKYIQSQCEKGKCVDLPLAGRFMKRLDSETDCNSFFFVPHLDLLSSGKFKFVENKYNVSPFSKSTSLLRNNSVTVSLTSVSAVCNMNRE